jgi:hypothetical protein
MNETFVEIEVLIDDAAELAAEAICACGCGMTCNCGSATLEDGSGS